MFSKIGKHLNIMWILLIVLTIVLGIIFVGIISIDKYCEENVLENVQSEEEVTVKGLSSLARNIAISIESIETTLRYEPDAMAALQIGFSSEQPAVQNCNYDNCIGVINNTYYNVKSQIESQEVKFGEYDWYKGACRQQDGALYVSAPYKDDVDGKEYVAFAKYVKSGRYVIALCMTTENLQKEISSKSGGYGYLVNVNGEVIATGDGENVGINVSTDSKSLPKGHDEVFSRINSISKKTIVETRAGDMYASKYVVVSGLNYVIVREQGKIINRVDSAYLRVIIAVILTIPIITALFIVCRKNSRRVTEVYSNKCEFIEGMALEMKIPLETIKLVSNDLLESDLDNNVRKKVDTILESTKAIAFDLNSAYDYSKLAIDELIIENEEYTFERILKNVESVVHSDVQKNNIYFDSMIEGNSQLKIYGDNRKIEEIIINTVKYCASQTIEGGVELKVMYADLTTDSVNIMLIIRDTGVGMNDKELPVFVEGLNAQVDGMEVEHSGIGLEMVKQLIKMLNGKISVDSTKNIGTVFTIMIPQKIIIGDDSMWQNEDVRTSSELTQLYGRLSGKEVDYSYRMQENETKSTKVEQSKQEELASLKQSQVQDINSAAMVVDKVKDTSVGETKEVKSRDKSVREQKEVKTKEIRAKEVKTKDLKGRTAKGNKDNNRDKGGDSLFGKKIKRLEDMIPQPELINDVDRNDFGEQQNNMFNNQNDMFNNQNDMFNNQNDMFNNQNDMFNNQNDMFNNQNDMFTNQNDMFTNQNDMYNNQNDMFNILGNEQIENTIGNEYKHIEYQPNYTMSQNVMYKQEQGVSKAQENKMETKSEKIVRKSVTQYIGEDAPIEVKEENEVDILEQQMRQQMEAQADSLYQQMTKRELENVGNKEENKVEDKVEDKVEISQEVQTQDPRIDLFKNTIGRYGIDVEGILTEFDNDVDSYERTLLEFYEYSRKNANSIVLLWNQKQFKEYFSAIDTIKAGAEGIGAHKLADMFNVQLQKGNEGDLKFVAGTIKDTLAHWKQLLAAVAHYEKSRNSL